MKTATNLTPTLSDSYEMEGYENRVLSDREINRMFADHGVTNDERPLDTTNWTLFDILYFLNY